MSLRILHILSSNFIAGSVMYAIDLAEKQTSEGNTVYLATDIQIKSGAFSSLQLPVSNRSFLQRFRNIRFLKKFIHVNQIDVIHAHSRAASWISFYAVRGTKTALISTIHGRQVKHSSIKKQDIFGDRIIGICPNLITHLIDEIKFDPNKLVLIPNGFDREIFKNYKRTRDDGDILISFIGRFNGPKGENIAHFVEEVFPQLLQEYPSLCIQLVGGEWDFFPAAGKSAFEELKIKYGRRIQRHDFSTEVHKIIINSDLLIAAGRLAIKGIFHGVPVFAIGEACCHGVLTKSNINEAILTNFGDITPCKSNYKPNSIEILTQFRSFLNNPHLFNSNLSEFIEQYDYKYVLPKIMQAYKSVIMRKACNGNIPILMYHKIPDIPLNSKHRIFVTKKKFEKHLRFYKSRGLTSITFKDYIAFANGDKSIREFPKKPIILTFDDGYEDNYRNMLPLAKKYGFKGVLFLLGNFSLHGNTWDTGEESETNRLMTFDQKKEFLNAGWEIGAHTLSHCDLTTLSEEKATEEIEMSKIFLEEKLQTNVISFAYPFGIYNEQIKEMVKKAGYNFGISTDTGGIHIEDDRLAVFRINMFPEDDIFQLYKKTSNWYRTYYFRRRNK
jgi:peptidoglycan/xylan/chitin deacetylase (PgdA/CDA1 family)/glycosyltransferase involved in cell wall biosynthesis